MNGQFQIGQITPWRYFLAVAVAVGLILGFTSPEPDQPFSLLELLLWQIQSLAAMTLLVFSQITLSRIRPYQNLGPWSQLVLSGALACLLIAPLYLWLDIARGLNVVPGSFSEWCLALLDEIGGFLPPIIVTWLAINAPFCLGYRLVNEPDSEEMTQESEAEDSTLMFMESTLEDLQYIKAELHYIKVVTSDHSDLILYNLKDAVSQLPSSAGTMCHRSYWVNFSAIRSFRKAGRQGELIMNNGEHVPVSRQHVSLFSEKFYSKNES